jgi:hypothetical protein
VRANKIGKLFRERSYSAGRYMTLAAAGGRAKIFSQFLRSKRSQHNCGVEQVCNYLARADLPCRGNGADVDALRPDATRRGRATSQIRAAARLALARFRWSLKYRLCDRSSSAVHCHRPSRIPQRGYERRAAKPQPKRARETGRLGMIWPTNNFARRAAGRIIPNSRTVGAF